MPRDPSFDVTLTDDAALDSHLLIGMAEPGVSGLTAVDYCVTHLDSTRIGHVRSRHLPDLTPFSAGEPRHPMRLYSLDETDLTVLVCEVFLPVWVADPLADALIEASTAHAVDEITVLNGSQFPHSEREHAVYHVATDEYRDRHFADAGPDASEVDPDTDDETPIPPLAGGFFDGVISELLVRSLEDEAPPLGVLVTPTHPPGPDLDGALRFLDALTTIYGLRVDATELQERSREMKRYYEELAQRMQALREEEAPHRARDFPDDRMYM
jgi:uncharacterized protein